jgi:hypothetical protein
MAEDDAFGFAPPPFKPDEALQGLRRALREMGLSERAGTFERRGLAIARVALDDEHTLDAAVVKRPLRAGPEWQRRALRNGADVREFTQDLKKKLAMWSDRDD